MKIDLKNILAIQTYSGQEWRTFAHCVRVAKSLGARVRQDKSGNLYITKGKAQSFPCVVAHLDSVHAIGSDLSILEYNGMLTGFNRNTMQQAGIGGDDKCGIYIALKCLEQFDNIKLAFFVDEERGCIGSGQADMLFFKDCKFVLQADRRGKSDFITNASGTDLSGADFQKAVQPYLTLYGFKKERGMMTDVMTLKENGLAVACANVSCGYYRPHSKDEYIVIADVENTLNLFKSIIKNLKNVYPHKYEPKTYGGYYGNYGARYWNGYTHQHTNTNGWKAKKEVKQSNLWETYAEHKPYEHKENDNNLCECCFEVSTTLTYYSGYNSWLCKDCQVWLKS
jgi:tripeptide aminopeptidase